MQDDIKNTDQEIEEVKKKLEQMGTSKLKTVEKHVVDLGIKVAGLKGDQDNLADSIKVGVIMHRFNVAVMGSFCCLCVTHCAHDCKCVPHLVFVAATTMTDSRPAEVHRVSTDYLTHATVSPRPVLLQPIRLSCEQVLLAVSCSAAAAS
jgi:hypothetical protein